MTGFRKRAPDPDPDETRARKALERAVAMLGQCQRNGLTMVAIEDVLTLLGGEPERAAEAQEPPRDPRADALTGALWAGPPGSSPPGN